MNRTYYRVHNVDEDNFYNGMIGEYIESTDKGYLLEFNIKNGTRRDTHRVMFFKHQGIKMEPFEEVIFYKK